MHRYVYFMIPSEGDHAADIQESGSYENSSYDSNHMQSHNSRSISFLELSQPLGDPQQLDNFSLQSFVSSSRSTAKPQPPLITKAKQFQDPLTNNASTKNTNNPFALSDQEREYLDKIATTNPVYTLFKRLCVYFHGQYHLEEIMWRENVSRSELRTVLSTYQDIIVCCLHE